MWTAPSVSPISHYTVYYNRSTNDTGMVNFSSTSVNGVITGLTNSTSYQFRISVTVRDIEGPSSASLFPGVVCYYMYQTFIISTLKV